jgi:hypothetical protein
MPIEGMAASRRRRLAQHHTRLSAINITVRTKINRNKTPSIPHDQNKTGQNVT